jgi:glyceraldehyde-3-phosphate dehydrogenase/erythrose-4-phosphate dehydrogenase
VTSSMTRAHAWYVMHVCDLSALWIKCSFAYPSQFDANAGISLNDHFCKLIAWYDNEVSIVFVSLNGC